MARFEIAQNINKLISDEEEIVIPKRQTENSAGYDLVSPIDITVPAHDRALIPTGITCKMESNEYLAIVPRSGLALKKGITVLNTPGTVDSDYYPNDIGIILYNTTAIPFEVKKGERIAQAILCTYNKMEDDAPVTQARSGGFGSTN